MPIKFDGGSVMRRCAILAHPDDFIEALDERFQLFFTLRGGFDIGFQFGFLTLL